jgi:(R,R)-butanediol dehydrogenase/meso-butanediol dehydrogenase/diacetyl reductase
MGQDRGGFAEFAAVPARHAFALADDMPGIYAALVEPFAVGLHGVHSAQITSGEDVLVAGAGGVGLTTIAWARAKGAMRVTAADPDPQRRESACTMGATDALTSVTDADPDAYDVALECVGRPELLQSCQVVLRPRGRIIISGACAESTPIEPVTALLKELAVRFSVCYRPDEFREVIDGFSSATIDPRPMVGPVLGLDDVADAFDLVRDAGVHGRILVAPGTAE